MPVPWSPLQVASLAGKKNPHVRRLLALPPQRTRVRDRAAHEAADVAGPPSANGHHLAATRTARELTRVPGKAGQDPSFTFLQSSTQPDVLSTLQPGHIFLLNELLNISLGIKHSDKAEAVEGVDGAVRKIPTGGFPLTFLHEHRATLITAARAALTHLKDTREHPLYRGDRSTEGLPGHRVTSRRESAALFSSEVDAAPPLRSAARAAPNADPGSSKPHAQEQRKSIGAPWHGAWSLHGSDFRRDLKLGQKSRQMTEFVPRDTRGHPKPPKAKLPAFHASNTSLYKGCKQKKSNLTAHKGNVIERLPCAERVLGPSRGFSARRFRERANGP
ncbi:hypothetical protein H920_14808 [Fukomys damarensis]|uniref:Uncharacterized protein n=1 Tax=Fukomys damarensis TaxID=885580 RepID=A0A091CVF4_FUKDA|nr:hypothetical protein H920_14808 [Fukomys damarensis]